MATDRGNVPSPNTTHEHTNTPTHTQTHTHAIHTKHHTRNNTHNNNNNNNNNNTHNTNKQHNTHNIFPEKQTNPPQIRELQPITQPFLLSVGVCACAWNLRLGVP